VLIVAIHSRVVFDGVMIVMNRSTVVPLSDQEVYYEEDNFDKGWTKDSENKETTAVMFCRHSPSICLSCFIQCVLKTDNLHNTLGCPLNSRTSLLKLIFHLMNCRQMPDITSYQSMFY